MRIYRIERGGEGAFTSGLVWDARSRLADRLGPDWDSREPDPIRHSGPYTETDQLQRAFDRDKHKFGFRDMDELVCWFDSEAIRVLMKELGGTVEVYEVPVSRTVTGRMQTIFEFEHAVHVETLQIPTLT
jgi:hypothetical protein